MKKLFFALFLLSMALALGCFFSWAALGTSSDNSENWTEWSNKIDLLWNTIQACLVAAPVFAIAYAVTRPRTRTSTIVGIGGVAAAVGIALFFGYVLLSLHIS